jgi:cell division protein FtsI (penicillin-binding protein 3)
MRFTLQRFTRTSFIQWGFTLFAVALVARAAYVQLLHGAEWRAKARRLHESGTPVQAPRGMILDATGALLVESREQVRIEVAPREVAGLPKLSTRPDTTKKVKQTQRLTEKVKTVAKKRGLTGVERLDSVRRVLTRVGVSAEWVAKATDTSRAYAVIPGRFLASDVQSIRTIRGVHSTTVLERVPAATDGLRRLIGHADESGNPIDGVEKALDTQLRGTPGRAALLRDGSGASFDSPLVSGTAPIPGNTVTLTINQALQDITERALADAVKQYGAEGGDIVVLDPRSGEVRAMASRRINPLSSGATALLEPYEPGSTLKPFVAARLLDLKRARVDEVMNVHGGKWELNGRKLEDDHPAAEFTLAQVIQYSSNIGIVQFAQRLDAGEQFELLRDLGFGAQTGLPYPGEQPGTLRAPRNWDKQTPASLAMGYALTVTPLQLATAYAAIANGGELLEPALVKEIRAVDGTVRYSHTRKVVRRVMSRETSEAALAMLRSVVTGGTGDQANLSTFDVAGKTGTAKRTEHGRYVKGKYTASFVGIFPADKPQVVILVKIDNPTTTIYGGKAAAPVSKAVLQAAIAARDVSLDRASLAAAPTRATGKPTNADSVQRVDSVVRATASGSVPFVFELGQKHNDNVRVVAERSVPDVSGASIRDAVHSLHRAGFRVALGNDAPGLVRGTSPAAGAMLPAGTVVRIERAP